MRDILKMSEGHGDDLKLIDQQDRTIRVHTAWSRSINRSWFQAEFLACRI